MKCTLAPPGEYDWRVCAAASIWVLRNYFDHLLIVVAVNSVHYHICALQHRGLCVLPYLKIMVRMVACVTDGSRLDYANFCLYRCHSENISILQKAKHGSFLHSRWAPFTSIHIGPTPSLTAQLASPWMLSQVKIANIFPHSSFLRACLSKFCLVFLSSYSFSRVL